MRLKHPYKSATQAVPGKAGTEHVREGCSPRFAGEQAARRGWTPQQHWHDRDKTMPRAAGREKGSAQRDLHLPPYSPRRRGAKQGLQLNNYSFLVLYLGQWTLLKVTS